jgi:hypothetical protein
MNKLFFSLCFIFIVASITSCKKTWTCECSTVTGSDSFSVGIDHIRKNDAKVVCETYSQFIGQCTIK